MIGVSVMGKREGPEIGERLYQEPRAHAPRGLPTSPWVVGPRSPLRSSRSRKTSLGTESRRHMDSSMTLLPAPRMVRINDAGGPRNELPLHRFRCSMAYKLGHWICHQFEGADAGLGDRRQIDLRERRDHSLERDATVGAAELLMAEFVVYAGWEEARSADALASRLDVSPSAMHWRLCGFGPVAPPPSWTDDAAEGGLPV